MAFQVPDFVDGTELAAADLSAKQFFGVVLTSSGYNLGGDSAKIAGVLQNDPISGAAATVGVSGISKGVAGAAFAKGVDLALNAAGKFIAAVSGKNIVAVAKQAAGADGDVVAMLLGFKGLVP